MTTDNSSKTKEYFQWVKASERTPDKQSNYHVRVKYDEAKPECWNGTSVWNTNHWEHPTQYETYTGKPTKLNVYEWLEPVELPSLYSVGDMQLDLVNEFFKETDGGNFATKALDFMIKKRKQLSLNK